MVEYPDELIRGISTDKFLSHGHPTKELFSKFEERDDDFGELSITWYDNEEAMEITLNQIKDGNIQFKEGVAVICRHKLDICCKHPLTEECLHYERKPTEDNKYHGNLLLKKSTPKSKKSEISFFIAATCINYIKKND